jgi:DNA-binding transcriptional LysR family regulator
MNFTLHQLNIFLKVAHHQNITRAAEEMFMTQPALSIQLRNFQRQFEIPLTEKIGKKLCLTDFGKSIALIAENILKEADALKYKTKDYKGLLAGKLSISSASTGKYVIPYFLSKFINKYPGIDLKLDVSNKATVIKSLKNKEIDFAMVSILPEKLDVHEEVLLENKLYQVSNTKTIEENSSLIFREEGSATRGAMDQYFLKKGKRKSIELTSNEAVKQAVIAGIGYSIIPLIGIKNELQNKELHIVPARRLPIITYWRLIWLKNKELSPIASAYLEYLRNEKEKIIEENFRWYVDF